MIEPDDLALITGTLVQALQPAVQEAIQKNVNGKIDKISEKLDKHIEKSDEHRERSAAFMDEMKPALQGVRFFQIVRDFLKWLGIPFAAVIVPLYLWLRN